MRYPALQGKRDANEPEIITALENAGATVEQLPIGRGMPDLLVGADMPCPACGHMFPQNKLEEVKTEKGFLNSKQYKWHLNWKGQATVVNNPSEALSAIGINADLPDRCRGAGL